MTKAFKAGDIFVAHPGLDADEDFGRGVFLVIKTGAAGTLAVNIAGAEIMDGKVTKSGPIDGTVLLHLRKTDENPGIVLGTTGYSAGPLFPDAESMKLLDEKPADAMVLMGYAGWGKGQLANEAKAGAWFESTANLEDLIRLPREERWNAASKGVDFNPPKQDEKPAAPKKKPGKSFDL